LLVAAGLRRRRRAAKWTVEDSLALILARVPGHRDRRVGPASDRRRRRSRPPRMPKAAMIVQQRA